MRAKTFMSSITALLVITASGVIAGSAAHAGDNHETTPNSSAAEISPDSALEAAGTYTVAEIYSKKSELKGRLVKVRGNVVKVSQNIMGRTWVHIQDGTGSEGGNKVVFRTRDESPAVGSVVTAQGTLETDKDFGFGYFYSVIVEDSTFSK
ncbi:MAG: hypothetical protein HZB84_01285 [Deltaproteobacteria bacterium]|nr:hypothetical protein [Deltaproteobacteria bacterium]